VPRPGSLVTETRRRAASDAMDDRQAEPGAVPDVLGGEKRLEHARQRVGGMPRPSSRISISTSSPRARPVIQMLPRSGIASHALASRFMSI
jgi:hypothetical protein